MTAVLFAKGDELTSHGYTYDQAGDRWADLMDASERISQAIETLNGLEDSPVSVEMLLDMKYELDAECRRMRGIMDDCRRI